jgi:sodium transport system ATP-binding protein
MIEARNLVKEFGRVRAVDDVSFSVQAGEIFGLLGPNGAGKTTTLRILATLLTADSGRASVAGHDVASESEAVRSLIGVVNGGMGLYDRLTGREVLQYFGRLYGLSDARIRQRTSELDDLLDLGAALSRQTGGFSTGMKQKIVIARAVLHDPPVIFFDEATSGLDVMARRAVLDFVKHFPDRQRAVIYSTHAMSEVEELCERIAIIYRGRLIAQGSVPALLEETQAQGLEQAFFRLVERSGLESVEA